MLERNSNVFANLRHLHINTPLLRMKAFSPDTSKFAQLESVKLYDKGINILSYLQEHKVHLKTIEV
jgi:hypothetical protein